MKVENRIRIEANLARLLGPANGGSIQQGRSFWADRLRPDELPRAFNNSSHGVAYWPGERGTGPRILMTAGARLIRADAADLPLLAIAALERGTEAAVESPQAGTAALLLLHECTREPAVKGGPAALSDAASSRLA